MVEASALDGQFIFLKGVVSRYIDYTDGGVTGLYLTTFEVAEPEIRVAKLRSCNGDVETKDYPPIGSTVILYGKISGGCKLSEPSIVFIDASQMGNDEFGVISKTTGFYFKGGIYTGTNGINCNSRETILISDETTTYENVTYSGCRSNGEGDWLKLSAGATIELTVSAPCTLNICFYYYTNIFEVYFEDEGALSYNELGNVGFAPINEYIIDNAGTVVITATQIGYIGYFEIVMQ